MIALSDYEVLDELVTTPVFSLQRVRQRNGHIYLLKKFFRVQPEAFKALQASVNLVKEQAWKSALVPCDVLQFSNSAIIVFEDAAGGTLYNYLTQHAKLKPENFFPIAIALINAIAEVHETGWIIKNLCSENIVLLAGSNECMLTDFSKATKVYKKEPVYNLSDYDLNLSYISPEQTGRINRVTDYRSDFYSLGVIFYELLTGRMPFADTDVIAFIHALIATPPAAPSSFNGAVPASLDLIILKLLSKNPNERYQSLSGLLFDLQQCRQPNQPFLLGKEDEQTGLIISEKLIGRKDELQLIKNAAAMAANGTKQVVYIKGYSGVGKQDW